MKLVIVESPTKAKSIEKYLGENYKVVSTKGAVRDLATSGKGGYGVDVLENFKTNYKIIDGKKSLITEFKKHQKTMDVILATDPDREGEAIAWHVKELLQLDENLANRVAFQEITKKEVLKQIENPRKLDINLVKAQEVRRILDRIVGFSLSKIVQTKVGGRSAGRVQSVALKLVVDLEKERNEFVPIKYFDVKLYKPKKKTSNFNPEEDKYLYSAVYQNIKALEITKEIADKIKNEAKNPYKVEQIKERITETKAKKPFVTSTIQQEIFNKFGYTSKKTMYILQSLFEGIEVNGETSGLITYIRTDSTRISEDFIGEIKNKILSDFGPEYLGEINTPSVISKQKIQDAHEAIRPTNLKFSPDLIKKNLSTEEYKVYKTIYERTISSLMSPAKTKVKDVILSSNGHKFKTTSRTNIFKGCLVFSQIEDTEIPDFKENDEVNDLVLITSANETKPKPRYTEASLIKKLEEEGIGRPSTYSTIVSSLKNRDYVLVEKKSFSPTDLGILVSDRLQEYFSTIINVSFTSDLEKKLDEISEGELDYLISLKTFYNDYEKLLEEAKEKMQKSEPMKVERECPNCGGDLIYKNSKYGRFIGCSSFPDCRYIESIKKVYYKKKK